MQAAHPEITKQLPDLLRDVLPRALVYYPVIVEMKQALANVEPPSSDGEFARSGLYACWSDMKAIFELRAATITLWETEGRPSPLSCYNLECAKVLNRDKFRRCSACQTAAYCSQACQRVDWTDGHREDCRLHQEAPRAFPRAGLCHRDKLFIRMIVHMDYRRLRVLVTMEMVRFMAENPDTPLVVNFDYTRGTPDISVFPISTSNGSEILSPYLRRLARAGGRLVAHTIRFGCGIPTFNVVWPLCAPTLEFNDGLKQIAREAKGLEEAELKSRVVKLTERTNRKDTEEGYYG
ncbi:hypothetical protein FB45DRAFT_923172 [Roridomyces roridus]|uniref:MYND-type domain-containing protein n=1 Tax=Roridomyces roridus TaxID=1738132 RepID=A0AAD7FIU7_9AGAR|nr:hypothetical protein FB45DRAFT_923172 [Roridomyces roridus]